MTEEFRVPICFSCQRLHKGKEMACDAYPDGIPLEIVWSHVDHTNRMRATTA